MSHLAQPAAQSPAAGIQLDPGGYSPAQVDAPLTLRFTEWRCGHHGQRPDDIAVSSPEQASQILRAISHAISQPGHARAVLMNDEHGAEAYITDDYVSAHCSNTGIFPALGQWYQRRPIVVYGSADEIAEIHSSALAEACEVDYAGPIPQWDGTTYVDDSIVVTTLALAAIEAKAAPVEWQEEGQGVVFSLPPVLRPAADLLAELRALAADLAAEVAAEGDDA